MAKSKGIPIEEGSLDDRVIEDFYKLGKELREIPEEKYIKSLKGILFEEASKYFNEKKDKETHELKWENDEQLKAFTDTIWDRAADHVAQHYLELDENQIKDLRGKKDPDNPDQTQFEVFIAQYLGVDKERLFEAMKSNEIMNAENLLEYLKPLYEEHIKIRGGKKISYRVQTPEDAMQLLQYTRLMKQHNPDVKLRIPKYFKSIEEAARIYQEALPRVPKTYHPKKPDTYGKK